MRIAPKIHDWAAPELLTAGLAPNPAEQRILVPRVAGTLADALFGPDFSIDGLILAAEVTALITLVAAFRIYLRLFIKNEVVCSVLAFSIFYSLPFNFLYTFWHPHDTPALVFLTLGLALLYRRSYRWYYPLFALATFNLENTLFLTTVFLATELGRSRLRDTALHSLAQILIWLAVRVFLLRSFGESTMAFVWTFQENWKLMTMPGGFTTLFISTGMLWLPVLMGYRYINDRFLQRAVIAAIPWIGAMFLVGRLVELRVFGELILILLPAALLAIQGLLSLDETGPETQLLSDAERPSSEPKTRPVPAPSAANSRLQ